jgi:hypothetical protein
MRPNGGLTGPYVRASRASLAPSRDDRCSRSPAHAHGRGPLVSLIGTLMPDWVLKNTIVYHMISHA